MKIKRIIIPVDFNKKKYPHLIKHNRREDGLIGFPILVWALKRVQNKLFWGSSAEDLVMYTDYRSTNIDKIRNRITARDVLIIYKKLPKHFLRGKEYLDETTLIPFSESDLI